MSAVNLTRWVCNICGIKVLMDRHDTPMGWESFTPVRLEGAGNTIVEAMHACHDCMGPIRVRHDDSEVTPPEWTQPYETEVKGFADSTMAIAEGFKSNITFDERPEVQHLEPAPGFNPWSHA